MRTPFLALIATMSLFAAAPKPKVAVKTSMGTFTIQLEPEAAPKTVENFLNYVRKGHYSGTIFHRVVPNMVIQGGAHLPNMSTKRLDPPVTHEGKAAKAKGLTNVRGAVAMALPVGNPFGGTCQFFVNTKANPHLDFKSETMTGFGHCVFGKVISGMEVVDKISKVKTTTQGTFKDIPATPVLIENATEVK